VRHVAWVTAGAVMLLTPAIGRADTHDPAAAEALFLAGRARVDAEDWANGCPMFVESNRLDPAPGTVMNLAACEEHAGKLATAWERYRELLDRLPPSDDRRAFVAGSVTRLERSTPRLTVLIAVPSGEGAIVSRDDVDLRGASLGAELPVDPGEHAIVVAAPGRFTRRYAVRLAAGQRLTLHAEVGEPIAQSAPRNAHTAEWILGGVGMGALSVGALLGARALSDRSASDARCTKGLCANQAAVDQYDAARSLALGADVAFVVGVASLGIAGYLLATSATRTQPQRAGASVCVAPSGLRFTW
jgi:hypothetical protein